MGYYTTAEIVKIVNKLIDRCGTRDPYKVAKELGINIIYRNFDKQRGAYKVILKNRFVFLKNGMHPVVEQIVLWHEIGHDVLHRQEAVAVGGFKEFNIFDMRENRMEYEANIFCRFSHKLKKLFALNEKIELIIFAYCCRNVSYK